MTIKGVKFGDIHSYEDLNLILAPFTPTSAVPKTVYVEKQGGDGSLDFTEAHGEVKYNDRDFEFTFSVAPNDKKPFDEKATEISNTLNGLKCLITLDRDPDYYWVGRLSVDKYLQDKNLKQFTVNAKVAPYKLKQNVTVAEFMLTETEQTVILVNGRKRVVPTITCTDTAKVKFAGGEVTLNAGTHKVLDICFAWGENSLTISGKGTIAFTYQEGEL